MELPPFDPKSPGAIGLGLLQAEKDSAAYQVDHACPEDRAKYRKCVDDYYKIDITERISGART